MNGQDNIGAQYADDFWLSLSNESDNINEVLYGLNKFYKFSGLRVNYKEMVIMPIGRDKNFARVTPTVINMKWSRDSIKILGIWIHTNKAIMMERNYSPLLQKVQDMIQMWRYKTLIPLGRIQVANSLMASLVIYRFAALPTPSDEFFHEFKTARQVKFGR